ncbi:RhoGAP-domain-containing protein, partial [Wolfiporia cocos MD-104 SS10]
MGQADSRPASPPPPPPPTTGNRIKRAWNARRKKSEDISSAFSAVSASAPQPFSILSGSKGKGRAHEYASTSDLSQTLSRTVSNSLSASSHESSLNAYESESDAEYANPQRRNGRRGVFSGRRPGVGAEELKAPKFSAAPPPPPPKEDRLQMPGALGTPLRSPRNIEPIPDAPKTVSVVNLASSSTTNLSPSTTSLSPMYASRSGASTPLSLPPPAVKEDWRKSDSTVTSRITIRARPGAGNGNRSPRPVSLAESSHSGHTIVANRRLSALLTEGQCAMVEEVGDGFGECELEEESGVEESGIESGVEEEMVPRGAEVAGERQTEKTTEGTSWGERQAMARVVSPGLARETKARNRRSMSLNIVPGHIFTRAASPTSAEDTPAARGLIAPSTSTGSNIRSRLAAWTGAAHSATTTPVQRHAERPLPSVPHSPPPPIPQHAAHNYIHSQGFRQTAVSMTGGLAPAAGLAVGLGKRAAERVGRVWGGLSSSSSSAASMGGASFSSSTSSAASSEHGHGYSHAPIASTVPAAPKRKRRFGAPSVASMSSSASDVDFGGVGPSLGRRVRGPRKTPGGASIVGGLVFARPLRESVAETAVDGVLERFGKENVAGMRHSMRPRPLEERRVPALVVRCAQHLLKWGILEEGLFRISGRSSHVARLRSEFDAGSDWDMRECDPSNLDPHAVASIFKAFLRELPESILTQNLIPYFESALASDDAVGRASLDSSADGSVRSTPSHARSGSGSALLHKAPSLSTLSVPAFAGKRTVSDTLLHALACLVSELPPENRDLLYTMVELIRATAAQVHETKMPMGNLLLILCPSLNMNPALLRVLCEHDSIWEGVPAPQPPQVEAKAEDAEEDGPDVRATFVTARETTMSVDESPAAGAVELSASSSGAPSTEDESSDLQTPEDAPAAANGPIPSGEVEGKRDVTEETAQTQAKRTARIRTSALVLPPISPISPVDSASFVSALDIPSAASRRPSPATRTPSILEDQEQSEISRSDEPAVNEKSSDVPAPTTSTEDPISSPDMSVSSEPALTSRVSTDANDDKRAAQRTHEKPLPSPTSWQHSRSQDSIMPAPARLPRQPLVPVTTQNIAAKGEGEGKMPVPFPKTSPGSTPDTPISRRKSFALLSFPGIRSESNSAASSTTNLHANPVTNTSSKSSSKSNTTSNTAASSNTSACAPSPPVASAAALPPSSWHRSKRPSLHLLLRKLSGGASSKPAKLPTSSSTNAVSSKVPPSPTPKVPPSPKIVPASPSLHASSKLPASASSASLALSAGPGELNTYPQLSAASASVPSLPSPAREDLTNAGASPRPSAKLKLEASPSPRVRQLALAESKPAVPPKEGGGRRSADTVASSRPSGESLPRQSGEAPHRRALDREAMIEERRPDVPPKLETTISSSPIGLGPGFGP